MNPTQNYRCRACFTVCPQSECHVDPRFTAVTYTCSDLTCGGTCDPISTPAEVETLPATGAQAETPRTDALLATFGNCSIRPNRQLLEHACQLERELKIREQHVADYYKSSSETVDKLHAAQRALAASREECERLRAFVATCKSYHYSDGTPHHQKFDAQLFTKLIAALTPKTTEL